LPKLFRQIVPQHWLGGGKTAVTKLVAYLMIKQIDDDIVTFAGVLLYMIVNQAFPES